MIFLSAFSKIIKNERGQIAMALVGIAILTGAIFGILKYKDKLVGDGLNRLDNIKLPVNVRSGIETMIAAYRQAEIEYLKKVSSLNCITANTFIDALAKGTECKTSTPSLPHAPISIFTDTNAPGVLEKLYHYGDACVISHNTGCIHSRPQVVEIGTELPILMKSEKIGHLEFRFKLISIEPKTKKLIIKATVIKENGAQKVYDIEFKDSNTRMAHMDADGKLKQSSFDPNDFCKNPDPNKRGPFTELLFLDEVSSTCKPIAQLGGGTGLTYYNKRYFSFRPSDGQIFDLIESSNPTSAYFMVPESGILAGEQVFPVYAKDILFNAEDITIIEDQIYYLKNQALYALIDPSQINHSQKICDFKSMGWNQTYVGLASKTWSDKLVSDPPSLNTQTATFYLKSFSGDLLTAVVWTTNPGFECIMIKDNAVQEIEYKRTYGFDKVVSKQSFTIL